MSESRQLSTKSSTSVPAIWMKLWMTRAKLLFSASEMVSTSFVK